VADSIHVCLLYNAPHLAADDPDAASEAGVLESVVAIGEALRAANYRLTDFAVRDSVSVVVERLNELRPDVIVNLCESFAGDSAGEFRVAVLLELLRLPFTGSASECLSLVRNKARAKQLLAGAGILTAPSLALNPGDDLPRNPLDEWLTQGPLFVKPAQQDASLGIAYESVVVDRVALDRQVKESLRYGPVLVERYIHGREFNVGIIELPEIKVLPLAEVEFQISSETPWPIVTYAGKWRSGSAADLASQVRCPATIDTRLAGDIVTAATEAYRVTGCRDYARVDLRVDEAGNICVLEVNANPDIGPNAGFARMLAAAGISYAEFTGRLVKKALSRRGASHSSFAHPAKEPSCALIVRAIRPDDVEGLLAMTRDCGAFRPEEIDVAAELLNDAVKHPASHYQVLVAETGGGPGGWACYGRIPMTDSSFDLYWIVVSLQEQRRGVGRQLICEVERRLAAAGGRWLLAETSSTSAYARTRQFYRRCGYQEVGGIPDFYRSGDGKITFGKRLDR
jgi:D-alanine-D-alanine ligase